MNKVQKRFIALLMTFTMIFSIAIPVAAEETASEAKVIEVLGFNDFHGALKEGSKDLGYAKLVGYINEYKMENPNTIVVSAGDNYNGTAISNLTLGEPVNEMFKSVGLVASAVGNHEFDWGPDLMPTWAEQGDFTFLASNIYDTATDEPVDWASPYLFTEVDGVSIALIGIATPETAFKSLASSVEGLEFREPAVAAQYWVDFLEAGSAEEGVPDVIIALTHLGAFQGSYGTDITEAVSGEAAVMAAATTGIDAIVTGHTHQSVAGYVNGVAIVQGYKQGRSLSHMTITVDGDDVTVVPEVLALFKEKDTITEDAAAKASYDAWDTELAPVMNEVVGVAAAEITHDRYADTIGPSELGKWVCEIMAEATDSQIAFQNGGGLRDSIFAGEVTMGWLYKIMPYDNTMYTMEITGAEVLANVEHGLGNVDVGNGAFSGLNVRYDADQEFGSRVISITLEDGSALDMDAYYTVVVNNFQATGGDNYMFEDGMNIVDTYIPVRDVMENAIAADGIADSVVDYATELDAYTIQSGDFLWKIAKKFGTTYQELGTLNQLKNVNMIYEGDMLYVPAQ